MTHHTFVEKETAFTIQRGDRKTKKLIISRPKDKLKKDSANIAMESIKELIFLKKDGHNCMKAEKRCLL